MYSRVRIDHCLGALRPPASALRTTHTPISVSDLSSMRTRSDARVAAHDRAHTNTPSNTLVCATRHSITLARHTTDTYITHRTRLSASRTSNNSRAEVTAHMSERTRLRANCLHTLPHPSARSPRDLREIAPPRRFQLRIIAPRPSGAPYIPFAGAAYRGGTGKSAGLRNVTVSQPHESESTRGLLVLGAVLKCITSFV